MPKIREGAARSGDRVQFHYTVRFSTGMVVNTTTQGVPVDIVLGKELAVPGLERALRGMLPGERKVVEVKADQAFGQHLKELVLLIPRVQLPPQDYVPGQPMEFTQPNGEVLKGRVRLCDDTVIVFDLNHPLAGQDLTYDITLVAILARSHIKE